MPQTYLQISHTKTQILQNKCSTFWPCICASQELQLEYNRDKAHVLVPTGNLGVWLFYNYKEYKHIILPHKLCSYYYYDVNTKQGLIKFEIMLSELFPQAKPWFSIKPQFIKTCSTDGHEHVCLYSVPHSMPFAPAYWFVVYCTDVARKTYFLEYLYCLK